MRHLIDRLFHGSIKEGVTEGNGRKLSVSENSHSKTFSINGTVQSIVMKNAQHSHEYWDLFPALGYLFDKPKVLMIGLGGGTVAHQLDSMFNGSITMDIAEIDRKVVELSRKFFGMDGRHTIIIEDGALLVSRKKGAYDIIILDAYDGDVMPAQFLGDGFAGAAYDALRENGVLAINYISTMRFGGAFERYLGVLAGHFSVYVVSAPGITMNSVIVCTKGIAREDMVKRIKDKMGKGMYDLRIRSAYENMEPFAGRD